MSNQRPQTDERQQPLWDDPAVEEVRAIRRKLWDASGRDIHRFIEQARQADHRRSTREGHKGDGAM